MKTVKKKLTIDKFSISKLNNLNSIFGGTGGDDDEHRTKALSSEICETYV